MSFEKFLRRCEKGDNRFYLMVTGAQKLLLDRDPDFYKALHYGLKGTTGQSAVHFLMSVFRILGKHGPSLFEDELKEAYLALQELEKEHKWDFNFSLPFEFLTSLDSLGLKNLEGEIIEDILSIPEEERFKLKLSTLSHFHIPRMDDIDTAIKMVSGYQDILSAFAYPALLSPEKMKKVLAVGYSQKEWAQALLYVQGRTNRRMMEKTSPESFALLFEKMNRWDEVFPGQRRDIYYFLMTGDIAVPSGLLKGLSRDDRCSAFINASSSEAFTFTLKEIRHVLNVEGSAQFVDFLLSALPGKEKKRYNNPSNSDDYLDNMVLLLEDFKKEPMYQQRTLALVVFNVLDSVPSSSVKKAGGRYFDALSESAQKMCLEYMLKKPAKNFRSTFKFLADKWPVEKLNDLDLSSIEKEQKMWLEMYCMRRTKSALLQEIPLKVRKKEGVPAKKRLM